MSNKAETYIWYRTPLINKKYFAISLLSSTAWFSLSGSPTSHLCIKCRIDLRGDLLGHLQSGEWQFVLHSIL